MNTGGRTRSLKLACELAKRHKVTVFTFYPAISPDLHDQLKDFFPRVECLPLSVPARASLSDVAAYAANALTSQPYQFRQYCRPEVRSRLSQIAAEDRYDVLLCDCLATGGVAPWEGEVPIVFFAHNVEAAIWQAHFAVTSNPLWKLVAWREFRSISQIERQFVKRADHTLTVSDDDRAAFLRMVPDSPVTTVPTGVDLDYFRLRNTPEKAHTLVFTGSMDWAANEDAILYFCSKILPRIRKQIPDARLSVVGRNPTRRILALKAKDALVDVTGTVEDIRRYVHEAAVYVVPLRIGGGTRIKIFEAMALAKPVVSTTIGAQGLPVRHGENVLLADAPETFAEQAVRLLRDRSERQRLGRAGRSLVESRYNWAAAADVVEGVLQKVSESRSGFRRPTNLS